MSRAIRFPILLGAGIALSTFSLVAQDPQVPEDKDPQTTASGLQYSVLKEGEAGDSPQMGDKVKVHYTGWLTDGTMFDSSRKRGAPAEFRLGEVIQGWNEGLQLMTPGARYKLTIPYGLAYGESGRPPSIPAKATLIFDVELLSFESAPKMPEFRKLDPEATKTTESGLKYQIIDPGKGEPPTANDPVEFDFGLWNTEGQLLQSSAQVGAPVQGKISDMRVAFLKEAIVLCKPGSEVLFEVPAKLFAEQNQGPGLPPDSVTIWQIKLLEIHAPLPVPEFVLPAGDGVVTTKSGLQYEVVKEGDADGASPKMGDDVKVHYAGWLTDGTPFDDSFGRGVPAEFKLGRVIQGWNEGLQLMKPGSVYRFVIPSGLAYGEQGSAPKIGPNAALVFYVELLD